MPLSLNVGASKSSVAPSFLPFIDPIQSHGSDIILYAHGSQPYDNGMNLFSKLQAHLSDSLLDDSLGKAKSNTYKLLPVHMDKQPVTTLFHPWSSPSQLVITMFPSAQTLMPLLPQLSHRHLVHLQLYWKIHPEWRSLTFAQTPSTPAAVLSGTHILTGPILNCQDLHLFSLRIFPGQDTSARDPSHQQSSTSGWQHLLKNTPVALPLAGIMEDPQW